MGGTGTGSGIGRDGVFAFRAGFLAVQPLCLGVWFE